DGDGFYAIPVKSRLEWGGGQVMTFNEPFKLKSPIDLEWQDSGATLPTGAKRIVPGSPWGTFTIACTIPIALLVGLWMYRIRPGKVVEASLIGAVLTIGATILGGFVPGSPIEYWFNLQDNAVDYAMAAYGFVAAVLPVGRW